MIIYVSTCFIAAYSTETTIIDDYEDSSNNMTQPSHAGKYSGFAMWFAVNLLATDFFSFKF